jgi:hypothetical protein
MQSSIGGPEADHITSSTSSTRYGPEALARPQAQSVCKLAVKGSVFYLLERV